MEHCPLSEAELYDILLKEEAQLRPKADRVWELIKIEPEKWLGHSSHSETWSFWVIAVFGRQVLWYDEIEGEFTVSSYETYGKIGDDHSPAGFHHLLEHLIRHIEGEQAYSS